jgi:hypothetical protein
VLNLGLDASYAEELRIQHPFRFWFRPEPIKKQISVNYDKLKAMGMSHGYHSYTGTDNIPVTFDLYVNRLMLLKEGASFSTREERSKAETRKGYSEGGSAQLWSISENIQQGQRYLEALTVPPDIGYGIIGGSPSPCILCIPGILMFRARLVSLETEYTESDIYGEPTELKAKCTFEEAPLQRYTAQDVLSKGSWRNWGLA